MWNLSLGHKYPSGWYPFCLPAWDSWVKALLLWGPLFQQSDSETERHQHLFGISSILKGYTHTTPNSLSDFIKKSHTWKSEPPGGQHCRITALCWGYPGYESDLKARVAGSLLCAEASLHHESGLKARAAGSLPCAEASPGLWVRLFQTSKQIRREKLLDLYFPRPLLSEDYAFPPTDLFPHLFFLRSGLTETTPWEGCFFRSLFKPSEPQRLNLGGVPLISLSIFSMCPHWISLLFYFLL